MTKIYVLSSTGNSLQAARTLAKNLGNTEILSIATLMRKQSWSVEGEKIGFVFPCYYGTLPQILRRFIEGADNISADYFFALATAGRSTGNSLKDLNSLLQKRNNRLHYGENLILGSNYMAGWYYEMIKPSIERLKKSLEKLDPVCSKMAVDIKEGSEQQGKSSQLNYLLPRIISPTRYVEDTRPWDREFRISESCNRCGTCASVCPVGNIEMGEKGPLFQHDCLRCMGCIQLCPKQAFYIGKTPMNKTPYKHPEISLKDLSRFHQLGKDERIEAS